MPPTPHSLLDNYQPLPDHIRSSSLIAALPANAKLYEERTFWSIVGGNMTIPAIAIFSLCCGLEKWNPDYFSTSVELANLSNVVELLSIHLFFATPFFAVGVPLLQRLLKRRRRITQAEQQADLHYHRILSILDWYPHANARAVIRQRIATLYEARAGNSVHTQITDATLANDIIAAIQKPQGNAPISPITDADQHRITDAVLAARNVRVLWKNAMADQPERHEFRVLWILGLIGIVAILALPLAGMLGAILKTGFALGVVVVGCRVKEVGRLMLYRKPVGWTVGQGMLEKLLEGQIYWLGGFRNAPGIPFRFVQPLHVVATEKSTGKQAKLVIANQRELWKAVRFYR